MAKTGKRAYSARRRLIDRRGYSIGEAVRLVKEYATAKFDETIEISMNLNVDPRHADQMFVALLRSRMGRARTCGSRSSQETTRLMKPATRVPILLVPKIWRKRFEGGEMISTAVIATPDMMPIVGRSG